MPATRCTDRWRPSSTALRSRPPATSSSRAASSRTAIPNTSSPPAAAKPRRPGNLARTRQRKSPGDLPGLFFFVIASEAKQSSCAAQRKMDCFVASLLAMTAGAFVPTSLKHRDVFQQRDHAEHDHDHPADLLGAAVERQHVDEIEDQDNDEKRDQYADEHAGSPSTIR